MVESELCTDKTKIVCDRCGYTKEFDTYADAITYLTGRGRLYGWHRYDEVFCYCPMCSSSANSYVIQMRLEMFA